MLGCVVLHCAALGYVMYVYVYVCLHACSSVCMSVRMYACMHVCMCRSISVCPSACLLASVCQSVSLSVCQSVSLSLCLSVSLYLRVSVCVSVYLPTVRQTCRHHLCILQVKRKDHCYCRTNANLHWLVPLICPVHTRRVLRNDAPGSAWHPSASTQCRSTAKWKRGSACNSNKWGPPVRITSRHAQTSTCYITCLPALIHETVIPVHSILGISPAASSWLPKIVCKKLPSSQRPLRIVCLVPSARTTSALDIISMAACGKPDELTVTAMGVYIYIYMRIANCFAPLSKGSCKRSFSLSIPREGMTCMAHVIPTARSFHLNSLMRDTSDFCCG